MTRWTPAMLSRAEALLRAETVVAGAMRRAADVLSSETGELITPMAVERTLARYGMRASKLVGTAASAQQFAAPPVDPVVEHMTRKRDARARDDRKDLLERLAAAEERVRVLDSISVDLPPAQIRRRERTSGMRDATAVILASDWHVEESVDPAKVEGLNAYDLTVADGRVRRFFDGAEWLIGYHRQAFSVRDVVLWLGGDLISGYIHDELAEGNALSPTEAVLWLRQRLRDGIKRLLADKATERIIVPCSYGNHGRTTEKRRIATGAENSFEWLLYNVLAGDFAEEPRVRFVIARGAHCYVQAYDFTLHFHHGDEISYQGGVGGISIPINKAVASWNTVKRANYHFFGHYHQRLEGRDWCANGSLIGYSPYAFSVKAQFEQPQQSFVLLDSKHGRCMSTPVWVGEDHGEESAA